MSLNSPLDQFQIKKIFELSFYGFDISFTNSSLFVLISSFVFFVFLYWNARKKHFIPTRAQSVVELLYDFVYDTLVSNAGSISSRYVDHIFTLFVFILGCNIIGIFPFSFTPTSHVAFTFTIAVFVLLFITLLGLKRQSLAFLRVFMPTGTPIFLAPLIVLIESFTYLARSISLSLRLASNMVAGHIVLHIIASLIGAILQMTFLGAVVPIIFLSVLTGFEAFIGALQAYIFVILVCVYLNDALYRH